jgi:hypothetical protein
MAFRSRVKAWFGRLACRLSLHDQEHRVIGLAIGPPIEYRCKRCGFEWLDWGD